MENEKADVDISALESLDIVPTNIPPITAETLLIFWIITDAFSIVIFLIVAL